MEKTFNLGEFELMRDCFERSRLRVKVLHGTDDPAGALGDGLIGSIGAEPARPKPRTLYRLRDRLMRSYSYFLLPTEAQELVIVGPYLESTFTKRQIYSYFERAGLGENTERYAREYYSGIPVLSESNPLLTLLYSFCKRAFDTESYAIIDTGTIEGEIFGADLTAGIDDTMINISVMEKRYSFENELIDAVRLGQITKLEHLLSTLSNEAFERRVSDPIRNAKNYGIIMNTLLRKAAESGGVHPYYIDKMSSDFAKRIESMSSLTDQELLMKDIFLSYCRLVRMHSVKGFSPLIQKALLIIDSALSEELSLRSIAKAMRISPGYLSQAFKREMGKTITEYITERRILRAKELLLQTDLQVQAVAAHCGIVDHQYFSKLFRRAVGLTPGQYRRKNKNGGQET